MIRHLAIVLPLLLLSAPLAAQDNRAAIDEAEEIARQMAASQQASAVAQQQFAAMQPGALGAGYRGAVAHPGAEPGLWQVVIVRQVGTAADAPMVALAAYEVAASQTDGGAIRSETIYPSGDAPYLEGAALFMARAMRSAPRAIVALDEVTFCIAGDEDPGSGPGPGQFNYSFSTIVLPPREDGSFDAYVLNGPIEPGAFPLGKHFRVPFDGFGQAGEPVLLTDTCEEVTWDPADENPSASPVVTEHEAGEAPNEVHAFISSQVPAALNVVIDGQTWPVIDGEIGEPAATGVPAGEAAD